MTSNGWILALAGCAMAWALLPLAAQAQVPGMPWVVQDDEGRRITLAAPAARIVSLSPGATALLFAAGAGGRVVGTAGFSVEPAAAARIPRIGDAHGFALERILALRPDVVIAWTSGTPPAELEQLERAGILVYHHRLNRLDELPAAIERFGRLADTGPQADAAAQALRARINALRARHAQAPPRTMLVQLWDQPVFTVGGGQLISDIIAACGYRNAFAELATAAPVVSVEAVIARDPEAILAVSDSPASGAAWLARWRALPTLRAVRFGQLALFADPRLSRMGPEVVGAAEALCQQLDAPRARPLVLPPH
jgi:iron complex transport system substrate-binding protein